MRSLTVGQKTVLFDEDSEEIPILLLELSHDDMVGTSYLSTDNTERYQDSPPRWRTMHNAQAYEYAPLRFKLPDDFEGRPTNAQFMVENVSRDLVPLARSVTTPGVCVAKIIFSGDLNTVVISYPVFEWIQTQFNQDLITFEVGLPSMDVEPVPAGKFLPSGFPGLF